MLQALINERIHFMYGNLKNNDISNFNLPSKDLVCKEEFYDDFTKSILRAKAFNIWSFEQIGLFDPFPNELMET